MIRFFRAIRKKLIDESAVRRYIVYATGEILLVVIGILIALQINNANELAKKKERTDRSLLSIRNTLADDIQSKSDYLRYIVRQDSMAMILIENDLTEEFLNKPEVRRLLYSLYHAESNRINNSAFLALTNQASDLPVEYDSLFLSLSRVYNIRMEDVHEEMDTFMDYTFQLNDELRTGHNYYLKSYSNSDMVKFATNNDRYKDDVAMRREYLTQLMEDVGNYYADALYAYTQISRMLNFDLVYPDSMYLPEKISKYTGLYKSSGNGRLVDIEIKDAGLAAQFLDSTRALRFEIPLIQIGEYEFLYQGAPIKYQFKLNEDSTYYFIYTQGTSTDTYIPEN